MTDEGRCGFASAEVPETLGRYHLGRLLGEGGMGCVYEAVHADLGKRVAIKILRAQYANSDLSRQRFLREGRAAATISHRNVADVYDVSIEGDPPYLVLELVSGETLASLLCRAAPLAEHTTADLLVPVVAGLAAAHDLGVVHRDLKPENIYLSTSGGVTMPKILDFGISKLTQEQSAHALTGTGAVLGTPHFMSPEQILAVATCDVRTDQYALGAVLYQCVTGKRPNEGAPLYALLQRTVTGDIKPPRTVLPGISEPFEAVVLKAMALRAEDRFPTARHLGLALLDFASDRIRREYEAELGNPSTLQGAVSMQRGASNAPMMLPNTLRESSPSGWRPRLRPPRIGEVSLVGLPCLALLALGSWWWTGGSATPSTTSASTAALAIRPTHLCRPPQDEVAAGPAHFASRWACLSGEPAGGKRELDVSQTIPYRIKVRNMATGEAVTRVRVRVCHALDVRCATPQAEDISPDADGNITLSLPGNFEGVAEIVGGNSFIPQLQVLQVPSSTETELSSQWNLTRRKDAVAWMAANGITWDETAHCLMAAVVYNCWGQRAAGVEFASEQGGRAYYFRNGFPSTAATQTDRQGLGGLLEVAGGRMTLEARVAGDHRLVARREWSCRAGWINSLSIMPPSCPVRSLFSKESLPTSL